MEKKKKLSPILFFYALKKSEKHRSVNKKMGCEK